MIAAESDAASAALAVVERFFDTALQGPADSDTVLAQLHPDFVDHDAASDDTGPSGVVEKLAQLWSAVPDGSFRIEQAVAASDIVAVRSTLVARGVNVPFSDFYRVADGRLAEHWHVVDASALRAQIAARA